MSIHLPHERQRRAVGAYVILAMLMAALGIAFFRIQVLRSSTWELRAESNRIRQLPVPMPRGIIYDRNGSIIADNVPGYAITLLPGPLDSARATLRRLSEHVSLPQDQVDRILATMARFGREVVVDADADFSVVSAIEERRAEFPGVYVEMRPRRRYLLGEAGAHVLGYVSEITADELASGVFPDESYDQGMIVGKTGIERQYEASLQGRAGLKYVEFDARGRIVGDFAGVRTDAGSEGASLTLNLDMELQRFIHEIFPDTLAGAVVALDPADGGVLALYSAPTFDPNAFVGGIDPGLWASLATDEQRPLYDRSVLGLYPPGSTWKLASAGIALDLGVVAPHEHMPVACTGGWFWGNRYWRCWEPRGHGFQTLAQAIGNSCDVYFYQLGLRVGLDAMLRRATDVGFSRRCGVDLPQESQGIFPAEREWWNRTYNYAPTEGEVLNLAIGQGPNSQTPLKIAQFYVALARDGSAPAPALARGVELAEGWSLDLAPEHLESLHAGLRMVTARGGTAHFGTALEHWEVIGKTGTSQNPQSLQGLAEDHAWFAGMAGPIGGDPEIVISVIVEHAGGGSANAAPIMAKAADFYLRRKYGIPTDTVQTYLDHVRAGRPAPWYARRFPPPTPAVPRAQESSGAPEAATPTPEIALPAPEVGTPPPDSTAPAPDSVTPRAGGAASTPGGAPPAPAPGAAQ